MRDLRHESERLKVWPTVIIPINAAASIKFLALKLDAAFIRELRLFEAGVYCKPCNNICEFIVS